MHGKDRKIVSQMMNPRHDDMYDTMERTLRKRKKKKQIKHDTQGEPY